MAASAGRTRVLLVEDNVKLLHSLDRALSRRGYEVVSCSTVEVVRQALRTFRPDALVLDVSLPDGDAVEVMELTTRAGINVPAIALSGKATPIQSFQLAQMGISTYLAKPVALDRVVEALQRALQSPPDPAPLLRRAVGIRPIHEVETEVRNAMVDEALERTHGNRQRAAGLLAISRQLLQHILRKRA